MPLLVASGSSGCLHEIARSGPTDIAGDPWSRPNPPKIDFYVSAPITVRLTNRELWDGIARLCYKIALLPDGTYDGCQYVTVTRGNSGLQVDVSHLVGRRFAPEKSAATLEINGRSFPGQVAGFKLPSDHLFMGRTIRTAELSLVFTLPEAWMREQHALIDDPNAAIRALGPPAREPARVSGVRDKQPDGAGTSPASTVPQSSGSAR